MKTNNNAYVIAEVGSNWSSLDDILTSVESAKACGADAVKLQLFNHKSLYGYDEPNTLINKVSLNREWLPVIRNACDRANIDFMCSAFSPEDYAYVDQFVDAHKIASAEMLDVTLYRPILKSKKPIIISTGGHEESEMCFISEVVLKGYPADVTFLYCVADYPARIVNLNRIEAMGGFLERPIGYSDHTTDVLMIPRIAVVNYGATVIEKHFNAVGSHGPDASHSLNPTEFKLMIDSINGDTSHHPIETEMLAKWRRRAVITKDIPEGTELVLGENYGNYRSKVMLPIEYCVLPDMVYHINGLRVKKDMAKGMPLTPGDIYGYYQHNGHLFDQELITIAFK